MSRSESRKKRDGKRRDSRAVGEWKKKVRRTREGAPEDKEENQETEDENPWLGNIKGILGKKDKDGEGAPPAKRARTDQMEVDSGPRKRPLRGGFTDKERQDHRRRKSLENKKKQLAGGGKSLSREEEEELRRLTEEDEKRERRVAGPPTGGVNPLEGGSRGAPGGGFVPSMQGIPESPFTRTGEGLDVRGNQGFP
uniref:HDAg-S n=1 Tax=Hepatitis delta virus TaxID=12475 RepID=E2J7V6_HDV|nr:HDAg-S [Hepatitis delta virus]